MIGFVNEDDVLTTKLQVVEAFVIFATTTAVLVAQPRSIGKQLH
jgi:hypothetical protein